MNSASTPLADNPSSTFIPTQQEPAGILQPRLRWFLAFILALVAVSIGFGMLHFFPQRFFEVDWLVNEHGNQLLRAQLIHEGAVPYRDFEFQYGPIPLYVWAGFARLFGNTFQSCAAFHVTMSALVIGVIFGWLSGVASSRLSIVRLAFFVLLAALPLGAFFRNALILCTGASFEYLSFERLWLIGLAATWRLPESRSWRYAAGVALLFLAWQLTKFGGGIFGVAALGAVDLLYLTCFANRRNLGFLRQSWFRVGILCGAAELARMIGYFCLLPPEAALRNTWPLHMAGFYPYDRLTIWAGFRHFAVFIAPLIIPALVAAGLTTFLLIPAGRRRVLVSLPAKWVFPALVGGIFYLGGSINKVGYFGREWLFFQYGFALVALPLLLVVRWPVLGTIVVLAAYTASSAMFLRSMMWKPPPPVVEVTTPVGWLCGTAKDPSLQMWQEFQRRHAGKSTTMFCVLDSWSGGGWYAATGQRPPIRNFLFEPGIRSHADHEEFAQSLDRIHLLIVRIPEASDPKEHNLGKLVEHLGKVVTPPTAQRIMEEFRLVSSIGNWRLLERDSLKVAWINAGNAGGR